MYFVISCHSHCDPLIISHHTLDLLSPCSFFPAAPDASLTKSFSSKAGNNKVHDTILMQLHKEKLYFHLAPYRHSTPYIRINNETLNTGQIYDTLSKMCLKYNILLMMLRACWKSFLLVLIKSCREGRLFCNPVINQRQERNQKKACDHINCKK